MPFRKIPEVGLEYALITFDGEGRERTDDANGGLFSRVLLEKIRHDQPSHVFLFCHGWKGDIVGAINQYDRWIGAMWKLEKDRKAMGADFRPLFIGLHWPSQPWGEESQGAAAMSYSIGTSPGSNESSRANDLLQAAVEHFGGADVLRGPLEVIFRAYEEDPAARVVPDEALEAYAQLGKLIGFSAGQGANAPPDEEGSPLDPQAAVKAERMAGGAASYGIFSSLRNGVLAGLRQASFWLMKHRARTVGEQGMHQFVAEVQQIAKANIHLMGHSFGCIVISSILGGPGGKKALPRPVNSAVLVQGAVSLWSYADRIKNGSEPGYFNGVLKAGAVSGPIVATQSANDVAVGLAYPAAVGLVREVAFNVGDLPTYGGMGTWGIQGTDKAEQKDMLDEHGEYGFLPGCIYNLNGSNFIPGHTGIEGPQVAHMIWQAALAARKGQRV